MSIDIKEDLVFNKKEFKLKYEEFHEEYMNNQTFDYISEIKLTLFKDNLVESKNHIVPIVFNSRNFDC